jgi:hypothetical protein
MLPAGSRQFVEKRLRFFEIGCVKAFGEPAVDRARRPRASPRRPRSRRSRARLTVARNSQSLAPCSSAMLRALR